MSSPISYPYLTKHTLLAAWRFFVSAFAFPRRPLTISPLNAKQTARQPNNVTFHRKLAMRT